MDMQISKPRPARPPTATSASQTILRMCVHLHACMSARPPAPARPGPLDLAPLAGPRSAATILPPAPAGPPAAAPGLAAPAGPPAAAAPTCSSVRALPSCAPARPPVPPMQNHTCTMTIKTNGKEAILQPARKPGLTYLKTATGHSLRTAYLQSTMGKN